MSDYRYSLITHLVIIANPYILTKGPSKNSLFHKVATKFSFFDDRFFMVLFLRISKLEIKSFQSCKKRQYWKPKVSKVEGETKECHFQKPLRNPFQKENNKVLSQSFRVFYFMVLFLRISKLEIKSFQS